MRNLALIALLAAITTCMSAQRMLSPTASFAAPRPGSHSLGLHAPGAESANRFRGRRTFPRIFGYPFGYFDDSFYSDALFSTGYPLAAEPPTIVVQSPPAAGSNFNGTEAPAQPLMIELRGDRYVRVSGEGTSSAQMLGPLSNRPATPRRDERQSAALAPEARAHDLSPVVLVFRDGHREEVSDYTIADGVLYTHGDYYANGSWNKKIELSSLNVQETMASNRSHGVSFRLPTAPNEVIVRP